jgi:hypothetical protein
MWRKKFDIREEVSGVSIDQGIIRGAVRRERVQEGGISTVDHSHAQRDTTWGITDHGGLAAH